MVMTPPQVHINVDVLLSAGIFPIRTVGEPGFHGAVVTGIQGIGVKTPEAAEVAEATVGFARLEHTPNGMIVTNGRLSMIVAAGVIVFTILDGKTLRVEGAAPKEHCSVAPIHTCVGISVLSR
jgi:hypothetical protein